MQALLSAVEARDSYTAAHSRTIVELAQAVARELSLPDAERAEVEQVALLHDLGKIGIPDYVLQRPDRLDEDATERMRAHPGIGEKIVASLDGLAHLAPAVRAEHERSEAPRARASGSGDRASRESLLIRHRDDRLVATVSGGGGNAWRRPGRRPSGSRTCAVPSRPCPPNQPNSFWVPWTTKTEPTVARS